MLDLPPARLGIGFQNADRDGGEPLPYPRQVTRPRSLRGARHTWRIAMHDLLLALLGIESRNANLDGGGPPPYPR